MGKITMQPRDKSGRWISKPKVQPQPQEEKVMLIEERDHIQTEIGIYLLDDARQFAKQHGGSYIFKTI